MLFAKSYLFFGSRILTNNCWERNKNVALVDTIVNCFDGKIYDLNIVPRLSYFFILCLVRIEFYNDRREFVTEATTPRIHSTIQTDNCELFK